MNRHPRNETGALAQAKARLTIPNLAAMVLPEWKPARSCRSPFRKDRHPSFSVSPDGRYWRDFGTGEHGDAVDFLARAQGLSIGDAIQAFIRLAGLQAVSGSGPSGLERSLGNDAGTAERGHSRTLSLPDDLHAGSAQELRTLAGLRGLNVEAVELASDRGLLRFGSVNDGVLPCKAWIVSDKKRQNAQARRMDGMPWQALPGKPKAKSLLGSRAAWPIGLGEAQDLNSIALVEGGPDLLAAIHFAFCEGCTADVAPVAMLGAGMTIPDEAVSLFEGKRVRIFPHLDEAGEKAASRWERQLADAGVEVDCVSLTGIRKYDGSPVTDLNDLAFLHADDFENDRALWNLFDCVEDKS